MFIFPAFISPIESMILLLTVALPLTFVIFIVWFMKKLNSIDTNIREIRKSLETQKHNLY
jgi:cell division protein FtsL